MSENEKMKKYCECMKYGRVQANAIFVHECKIDSTNASCFDRGHLHQSDSPLSI